MPPDSLEWNNPGDPLKRPDRPRSALENGSLVRQRRRGGRSRTDLASPLSGIMALLDLSGEGAYQSANTPDGSTSLP